MTIDIVQIREEHIEGFHAALDVVARERRYLAFLEAPPIESTRQFVARNIARNYPQLVVLDGDQVAGWCDVTPPERPSMRHAGVLGLALLPAWRGRGLGERLMRAAIEAARAFGLARVELSVRVDNARAIALYRKLGFASEGVRRRALLVDEAYHDLVMMALLFDEPGSVSDPADPAP
jgi:ribosomal protein S18 acetylase RimI-like enzyme